MGNNSLHRISGGSGCDIVNSASGDFVPRKGKIYAIYVREDSTNIEHIVENNNGTEATITSRSYIGGDSTGGFVDLNEGEWFFPDYPITEITLTAGSVIVYYDEYLWKHKRM